MAGSKLLASDGDGNGADVGEIAEDGDSRQLLPVDDVVALSVVTIFEGPSTTKN